MLTAERGKHSGPGNRTTGVTLIELLVALTIAGIMLMFAVPAFNDFTAQRRMASNVNLVVSAINYARSEAARQSAVVSVQALDAADNDNEWGPGFCVTLGDPGNCDAPMIRYVPEGNMTFNAINGLDGVDSWSFNSRGMLLGGVVGQVDICGVDGDDDPGRSVRISAIGRASTEQLTCF